MEPNDAFLRAFLHACFAGDLSETQEAIATGRLTAENLNKGLKRATHSAHPDIVAALFDAGASVSTSTVASLPGPNLQQQPSVVRHFLDHGLDPNSRLSSGEPLLPDSVTNSMLRNPASVRLLLSAGADPNICGLRKIPPLGRALVTIQEEDLSLLEPYIEYGATLSADLLFFAMAPRVRQAELKTQFLLNKGLDPNVTSDEWGTPLHCAIRSAKPNLVKLLLDAGADPTVVSGGRKTYGKTPTQVAESVHDPSIREAILSLLDSHARQDCV
ncbi:ankyrin repeat-containing domain protein [Aspergillus transmontanensis]|uniref:Ankyrin repeat-containing domain protein n=1 Tax=Aspergillus transmontanensis TaxID=1034304 RepID=A0A5N6VNQ1_9EURO|nr:ankyrin repeat-containing domain protein [Aspergillus transmontanensis]